MTTFWDRVKKSSRVAWVTAEVVAAAAKPGVEPVVQARLDPVQTPAEMSQAADERAKEQWVEWERFRKEPEAKGPQRDRRDTPAEQRPGPDGPADGRERREGTDRPSQARTNDRGRSRDHRRAR